MSTPFYDLASLVLVPSGYKASKVYAQKPLTTDGQLAFTRASTATRVNSAGLIEKVRTNLVLQSEALNTTWTDFGTGTTVTPNATTAPDGTLTADLVSFSTQVAPSQQVLAQTLTLTTGVPHTISFYAKAVTGTITNLVVRINGAEVSLGQTITTTWQRFSKVITPVTATDDSGFKNRPAISGSGAAIDVYIWGVQIETGDIATDYIATTSAAVSVGPVANVPRLDYLNSSCPRLLLEPQRTNLLTFSEQFDNAAWLNAGGTTTANTAVSPSGYQDADTLTGVRYQASFASNTYTLSAFAKKVDGDGTFVLRFDAPTTKVAVFNLNNGTIVSTDAGYTSTITAYGNGWYRCTFTSPASTTISNAVLVSASAGVSSTFVYGCQLEVGSYATSYIPTLGAAVTRGADAASKTGISSLIGQTEGTLFAEFNVPSIASAGNYATFNVTDGTSSNLIDFTYYPTGRIQAVAIVGGSVTVNIDLPSYGLTAGTHKVAFAYKLNDYVLYVDGVQRGSDTSSAVPATSRIDLFAGLNATQVYNQALLFKTRLTNAQLAELTTI